MNRAQPELEQVQEVLDFITIKFLLSLKVPAQSSVLQCRTSDLKINHVLDDS